MSIALSEEQELFARYQSSGDTSLLAEIMTTYSYITEILARRFTGRGIEFDDIYQSASIGLMNAVKRYNPSRGTRFSTFATPTILGEIKRLFRDKGNCIRIPRRLYETFVKANKIRNEELMKNGKMPTADELAQALDVPIEQIMQALHWGDHKEIHSLDYILNDQDTILSDCIGAEDNEFLMIENKDFVESCIRSLPEKEQEFIKFRFYDEMTQTEIAQLM
ncbi:MAG: sigma-70 family RNA polymerase sigma factor, partial [Ruminococcaceae bacterium]|nr:sigma-70 family RNA polymerase sigma factor [Oscillospiraceae bacterium]